MERVQKIIINRKKKQYYSSSRLSRLYTYLKYNIVEYNISGVYTKLKTRVVYNPLMQYQ